ncbi:MAG: hypothetical protein Ct9H90mP13_05620 [Pseudomonadota bacterium]|nr:MAG: hypothetical protein Ct9H90mP13_05620 [Pseudomonadota bacterium]
MNQNSLRNHSLSKLLIKFCSNKRGIVMAALHFIYSTMNAGKSTALLQPSMVIVKRS